VPSGILHDHCACVVGNGVVIDVQALLGELAGLREAGISYEGRLLVSSRAHLILPYHRELERISEEQLGIDRVGTTMRGIGPAYEDKVGRRGIRAGDLLYPDQLADRVRANVRLVNERLAHHGGPQLDADDVVARYVGEAAALAPMVADTSRYLNEAIAAGKNVLLEGAQATMLDIDHGTYPFVTSSNATAGGACVGTGIPPTKITGVLGIAKAYATRVGAGPFPTELEDATGEHLRARGHEFGASTGRPRRTGWFDVPVLRYSAAVNGLDSIAMTKLDVRDELDEVKVCVGYRLRGETIRHVPESAHELGEAEPVYRSFPGWKAPTSGIATFEELPARAREYVDAVADLVGVEIGMISTGPDRSETILRPEGRVAAWIGR
jgi:adenylosuccinate synthase